MIICYCRVSTEDQNPQRQIESTTNYAQDQLGAQLADIEVKRDKSTGTNTDRSGYRETMELVESGEVDAVVTHAVSRISRSIRDLDATVERVVRENDTELHIVKERFELVPGERDPFQDAMLRLMGVFAQLEAELAQQRTKEGIAVRRQNPDYHHGPAPLGFNKDSGELVPTDQFDRVATVLSLVQDGSLSKRAAADELNTSRKSIYRALDSPALYGLRHGGDNA
ncbi:MULTISPECIES: recombinase family protein [unclassified Haloarcula]|uniref:recombinase family protein n=1 Tax=unclassified Haloarcula TaxID=2624677 RepID=UPI000EF1AEB5|nr:MULTISPECIES: recombinase family protein [unclassified Haloarcula]RLM37205.1 resolvase [Haloarcula sp. Atlit-120R]RLM44405.1 resolvase [Haloarcula sp. Atlit-47R]